MPWWGEDIVVKLYTNSWPLNNEIIALQSIPADE